MYGPPGTGKTAWGRYIAGELGRPIHQKRVSDLIRSHVGETEELIAESFAEATREEAILFFDEADSYLTKRSEQSRSWERTIVNCFLTEMEEFQGILFCATNAEGGLDPAVRRRFHLDVEFKPLERRGAEVLLAAYFPEVQFSEEAIRRAGDLALTPADFEKTRWYAAHQSGGVLEAAAILEYLENCARIRKPAEKIIGFSV